MKKLRSYHCILLLIILYTVSCKKTTPEPDVQPEPATGQATFWTNSNLGTITVNINGTSRTISQYYSSGLTTCAANGCANFELSPGNYNFTASNGSKDWNGTITVTSGGCSLMQLTGTGGTTGEGTTKGQATFWTNSNLGPITVNINGGSGTISQYYSSGLTTCGATGCANFDLSPGNYSFTATSATKNWSGTIAVTSGKCSLMQLTNETGGNTTTTGKATFWTDANLGAITVNINGISRTISQYFSSGLTTCGAAGSATFDLSAGSYSFTATSGAKKWNGTIAVTSGGCSLMQLTSSNESGGNTTTNGQVTFWTNANGGTITVNVSGISRTITQYYSSGITACGANGCATFDLNPGSYSYAASNGNKVWNGTIKVTSGDCLRMQLVN